MRRAVGSGLWASPSGSAPAVAIVELDALRDAMLADVRACEEYGPRPTAGGAALVCDPEPAAKLFTRRAA